MDDFQVSEDGPMNETQEDYVALYRTGYKDGELFVFIYARGGYRKALRLRLRKSVPKIIRRWA